MSNWTGQVIKIPRNLFSKNQTLTEISRPGVYFLFGFNEENPDDKLVYVGETDKLNQRIAQHLKNPDKSFAETIICFSSKDENLTVSHTKYLEQKLIQNASKSSEYRLVNSTGGNSISLPKMVRDEMDTFYDNLTILLPTPGFSILNSNSPNYRRKIGVKRGY